MLIDYNILFVFLEFAKQPYETYVKEYCILLVAIKMDAGFGTRSSVQIELLKGALMDLTLPHSSFKPPCNCWEDLPNSLQLDLLSDFYNLRKPLFET